MSGVYIKGMEMPKNCCICHFSSHDMCLLCKRDAEDWFENRPEYCPLVEVPDHGDLIDRDAPDKPKQISAEFAKLMREGEIQVRWKR